MDAAVEQSNPTPPEFAVEQLAKQLTIDNLVTVPSALNAIQKAALNTENTNVRLKAVSELTKFAGIQPRESGNSDVTKLRFAQNQAREKIAAIAFGSEDVAVRLVAILGLGKSLDVAASPEGHHQNTLQLIAILGRVTADNDVKNAAIAVLSEYSARDRRGVGRGYYGSTVHPDSQIYANTAVGVVSKPAQVDLESQ